MGASIERDGARIRESPERVYAHFPVLGQRRALLTHPELVMPDEPSLGLSPKSRGATASTARGRSCWPTATSNGFTLADDFCIV